MQKNKYLKKYMKVCEYVKPLKFLVDFLDYPIVRRLSCTLLPLSNDIGIFHIHSKSPPFFSL